jgi:CRISPR-associated protein Cas8a1/Csx13
MTQLTFSLLDPNTLLPHRAGIAGLALALSAIQTSDSILQWKVEDETIALQWECKDKEAIEWLVRQAYQIHDGLLIAPSLNLSPQGRYTFSEGIIRTFLQHSKQRALDKTATSISFHIEDNQPEVQIVWRKLLDCYYLRELKGLFNKKGNLNSEIPLKGHHLPGLIECFVNGEYKESKINFLSLLFLPLACSYYRLTNRRYALVIPEVVNLNSWVIRRQKLSGRSYRDFQSSGGGESGLRLLLEEWVTTDLQQHRVKYCEVYQLGKQPWDGNQSGLKQAVYRIHSSDEILAIYQTAIALFPSKLRVTDKGVSWIAVSNILPWITDNLILAKSWYSGFFLFQKANNIYERKGLIAMSKYLQPTEQVLFDAVQGAFSIYLREQIEKATRQGRPLDYPQVTNKVVYRLQRPSTQQDFATTLVDFLSQFRSKAARSAGPQVYAWIHGSEWRKARDLAMLAIATYQGKGMGESTSIPEEESSQLDSATAEAENTYSEAL